MLGDNVRGILVRGCLLWDAVRGTLLGDNFKGIFVRDVSLGLLFWDNVRG